MAMSKASAAAQRARQRLMGNVQRAASLSLGDRWLQLQMRSKLEAEEADRKRQLVEQAKGSVAGTTHKMGALGMSIGSAIGSIVPVWGTFLGGGIGHTVGTATGALIESKQRGQMQRELGIRDKGFLKNFGESIWRAPTESEAVALAGSGASMVGGIAGQAGYGIGSQLARGGTMGYQALRGPQQPQMSMDQIYEEYKLNKATDELSRPPSYMENLEYPDWSAYGVESQPQGYGYRTPDYTITEMG